MSATPGAQSRLWLLPRQPLRLSPWPLVMGVVNVTPDSFSDGGHFATREDAIAHGLRLVAEGADLLDVGGESTRPGAATVTPEEELRRVLPVVQALRDRTDVPISVDTSKAAVAGACLEAGAQIVNDVTALAGDPDMAAVVRTHRAGAILMHMQGTPATMQQNPQYADVVDDIALYFRQRLDILTADGIDAAQLALDPGIGFGKTLTHNLQLLSRLDEFQQFGRPVCLGVSRKGFIGTVLGRPVDQRVHGSLAVLCHALARRAVQIIRVHDVAATRDVVRMWQAIEERGATS